MQDHKLDMPNQSVVGEEDPGAALDAGQGTDLRKAANPGEPYANAKPGTTVNDTAGPKAYHPADGADRSMMQSQQTESERARKSPDGIGKMAEPDKKL